MGQPCPQATVATPVCNRGVTGPEVAAQGDGRATSILHGSLGLGGWATL